ncbi:MAG: hypothetical protein U1E15_08985 [Hyphomicrobiales bacterium]
MDSFWLTRTSAAPLPAAHGQALLAKDTFTMARNLGVKLRIVWSMMPSPPLWAEMQDDFDTTHLKARLVGMDRVPRNWCR